VTGIHVRRAKENIPLLTENVLSDLEN